MEVLKSFLSYIISVSASGSCYAENIQQLGCPQEIFPSKYAQFIHTNIPYNTTLLQCKQTRASRAATSQAGNAAGFLWGSSPVRVLQGSPSAVAGGRGRRRDRRREMRQRFRRLGVPALLPLSAHRPPPSSATQHSPSSLSTHRILTFSRSLGPFFFLS